LSEQNKKILNEKLLVFKGVPNMVRFEQPRWRQHAKYSPEVVGAQAAKLKVVV
jgi:hypothetical protein